MCNGNYHLSSPNPENNGQKMEKDNGYSKYQEFFTGLYADAQTAIGEVKVVTPPSSDKAYDLQGAQSPVSTTASLSVMARKC